MSFLMLKTYFLYHGARFARTLEKAKKMNHGLPIFVFHLPPPVGDVSEVLLLLYPDFRDMPIVVLHSYDDESETIKIWPTLIENENSA